MRLKSNFFRGPAPTPFVANFEIDQRRCLADMTAVWSATAMSEVTYLAGAGRGSSSSLS